MITFVIAVKDSPEIDSATLEMQILSCLRVENARVLVGLSDNAHCHMEAWRSHLIFSNPRVSLTVTQDKGLYEGWNKLVEQTQTPLVSFLGIGDVVLQPKFFSSVSIYPSKHNAVFSRVVIIGQNRSRFFGRTFQLWRHKIKQEVAFIGAVFDRSLIAEMPFDESYKIVGDYEWLMRCAPRLNSTFIPTVSVAMDAGGMSESLVIAMRLETVRAKSIWNSDMFT